MGMTREIALHCMKSASELESELCKECPIYGQTGCDHCYEDALRYVIGMLEQEPITKNDFVSRAEVLKLMKDNWHTHNGDWAMQESMDDIRALPSVTPEETFIDKPCVSSEVCEHDKQKVLDKIKAEIEQTTSRYCISRERGGSGQVEWSDRLIKESEVLGIIDKYKAESEVDNEQVQ